MTPTGILEHTLANAGGTWLPDGRLAIKGFAVGGIEGTFSLLPVSATPAEFAQALVNLRAAFPRSAIGTWVDAGTIHLDPINLFPTEMSARVAAEILGQLAYFDIAARREVRL